MSGAQKKRRGDQLAEWNGSGPVGSTSALLREMQVVSVHAMPLVGIASSVRSSDAPLLREMQVVSVHAMPLDAPG